MTIEEYVNYVEELLQLFEESNKLLKSNYVIASDVNRALAIYGSVSDTLIIEHQRRLFEAFEVELDYRAWWDEKYVQMRRDLNPSDIAKSKWLSKGEIESEIRVKYAKEYREKQIYLNKFELKVNLMRRLLDRWKLYKDIIVNLSQNMRQDMKSLHVIDEANFNPPEITENRVRQVRQ